MTHPLMNGEFFSFLRASEFAFLMLLVGFGLIMVHEHRDLFATLFLWMGVIALNTIVRDVAPPDVSQVYTNCILTAAQTAFTINVGVRLYMHTKERMK